MPRTHNRFGCLNCGKRRSNEDIISKKYDVYLKDSVSNSLMRIGLCEECFSKMDECCLDHLKENLFESEKEFAEKNYKPLSEKFSEAKFVGRMSHADFWNEVKSKQPKLPSDYVGIIQNERN